MRLIDADALIEQFDECPYNWTDSPEEIQAVLDWEMAINNINKAPTIPAITVEWLHSQMKNNPNDIESAYDDICINELIQKWQKEQETKQCEIHD